MGLELGQHLLQRRPLRRGQRQVRGEGRGQLRQGDGQGATGPQGIRDPE